jgi:uncharacterized protein (DUF302 family)
MSDGTESSEGVITRPSSKSVAQTIDGLKRVMAERRLHSVQRHRSQRRSRTSWCADARLELVMFGKPALGAAVMLAEPLATLDIPLKVLVWEDKHGAVSVSYNSPEFLAERHHLQGHSVRPSRRWRLSLRLPDA